MNRTIITVIGKDRVGIIATVCTYLAEHKINILDIDQSIIQGYFHMMMIVDANGADKEFASLVKDLDKIGEDMIRRFILAHPSQSVLFCGLTGLIPSCASSIILTTMYIDSVIPFSAVCAGLLVNAGTGMIMLYRVNPDFKDNTKILLATLVCGLIAGFALQIFGL